MEYKTCSTILLTELIEDVLAICILLISCTKFRKPCKFGAKILSKYCRAGNEKLSKERSAHTTI